MRSTYSGSPAASSQARNPRFATNGFSMKMAESRKIVLGSCIVHLMKYKIDQGSSPESLVNICYETLACVCGVVTLTLTSHSDISRGLHLESLYLQIHHGLLVNFQAEVLVAPRVHARHAPTICE